MVPFFGTLECVFKVNSLELSQNGRRDVYFEKGLSTYVLLMYSNPRYDV